MTIACVSSHRSVLRPSTRTIPMLTIHAMSA